MQFIYCDVEFQKNTVDLVEKSVNRRFKTLFRLRSIQVFRQVQFSNFIIPQKVNY
jgi:hypothetical protein